MSALYANDCSKSSVGPDVRVKVVGDPRCGIATIINARGDRVCGEVG